MIGRVGVGLVVFLLALDKGTYALDARHTAAVAAWWALLVTVGLAGLWWSRASLLVALPLAGLALWTGASLLWAESAERAVLELDRVLLYLGVFLLAGLLAGSRARIAADGLALGIAAVAVTSLSSRLFPEQMPTSAVPELLPGTATRLMYPVEYWNGLAVLLALAIPLCLRATAWSEHPLARIPSAGAIPILGVAVFLTSSRGGTLAALVGVGTYLALTRARWAAATAALVTGTGTAGAIVVALSDRTFMDGPFTSNRPQTATMLLGVAAATGVAAWAADLLRQRLPPPRAAHGRAALAVVSAAVAVLLVLADPVERARSFTETPDTRTPGSGFVTTHLLSGGGGGRWQFWSAAVEQFRENRILGDGAGSFEAWWAERGSFSYFVRDAHSLYLETLGELGVVGLLSLVAFVSLGLFVGARRSRTSAEGDAVAALTALFAAFSVAAAFDWMWELTVVSAIAVAALAAATAGARVSLPARSARVAFAAVALGVVVVEALPLLAQRELRRSERAAQRADLVDAREAADVANGLTPWAASPQLQAALVEERFGDLDRATAAITKAIGRDSRDWRLWLVSARIAARQGRLGDARESIARARALNPRSPLFVP